MTLDYHSFILHKQRFFQNIGFEPVLKYHPSLFGFQKALVTWAIRKGKAAIWAGCGLGKTRMQLEWARAISNHTGNPVLILAPLAVSAQTISEGKIIDICVSYPGEGQVQITNYEKLHKVDPSIYSGIVLDECFPYDTPIECFSIGNSLVLRRIKDIKVGDKILNAQGEDHVKEIYKRKINRAVQISVNGRKITCSENHPFFTVYGWRCAQDLHAGDYVLATRTAMRLVRGDFQTEILSEQACEILREILLSEMENGNTGVQGEGSQCGCGQKERGFEVQMAQKREPQSFSRNRESAGDEPNSESGNQSENICYVAENEAQTFRAWGKWSRADTATAINEGCVVRELGFGIRYITGKTETGFSDMLQSRFRQSRVENSDRDRRSIPLFKKNFGSEKRKNAGVFRVESVEILEQGHPKLERYRDESGIVYFYDIKAERHPSFSVDGVLVHNSSILKNFAGKFKNQIIDSFSKTPFKLCCSATPSPNDYTEIGNHAEFLNVCSRAEMLSTYFVHDSGSTQDWRVKGHAEKPFFKWLASWACMINKPSDIGFDDTGFVLPPMNIYEHVIKSKASFGKMFVEYAGTLQERRQARRESIVERCKLAAQLSVGDTDPWLYWCDLNDESSLLSEYVTNSVEVKGADSNEQKEERLLGFALRKYQKLISKPKIAQFGMNWQHCNNVVFVGLSDSFEAFYQAVRRCWRFGQNRSVGVHIVISEKEGSVVANIKEKERKMEHMTCQMIEFMRDETMKEIGHFSIRTPTPYNPSFEMRKPKFMGVPA